MSNFSRIPKYFTNFSPTKIRIKDQSFSRSRLGSKTYSMQRSLWLMSFSSRGRGYHSYTSISRARGGAGELLEGEAR